jgi:hypothetical protein
VPLSLLISTTGTPEPDLARILIHVFIERSKPEIKVKHRSVGLGDVRRPSDVAGHCRGSSAEQHQHLWLPLAPMLVSNYPR